MSGGSIFSKLELPIEKSHTSLEETRLLNKSPATLGLTNLGLVFSVPKNEDLGIFGHDCLP